MDSHLGWAFITDTVANLGWPYVLCAVVVLVAIQRTVYALLFSPLRHIPGPLLSRLTGKRSSIIGSFGYTTKYTHKDSKKYGDIYVYQPNAVVISHPDDIRTVFGSHTFRKTDFYRGVDMLGVEHMFSTRSPELADMRRRQFGPYLNTGYLAKVESTLAEHGPLALKAKWDALLEQSADGKVEINYHRDFLLATFDTLCSLAFGRYAGALANEDWTMVNWVKDTFTHLGICFSFPLLNSFPFSILVRPWKRGYDAVAAYAIESVDMRRKYLASHRDKPVDLLQTIIDAVDPESKTRMTERQVQAECLDMLLAGSETGASTMMWTIHLLMLHPQYYRRVVDEVRQEFSKDHLISSTEARSRLPFLEACLFESMRLHPVSGGLWPRKAPKNGVVLRGQFVPGGTDIFVSIAGAHHNPAVWAHPLVYNPERFINNQEAKRNLFTFGSGVRICPGRHLAVLEMMSILANMIKDYDMAVPEDYVRRGPNVLDENGNPKLMESLQFLAAIPVNPKRDCRLIITRQTE